MTSAKTAVTKPRIFISVSSHDEDVRKKLSKELSNYFFIVEPTSASKGRTSDIVKKEIGRSQYVLGYFSGKGAPPISVANEVALGRALGKKVVVVSPKSTRKKMNAFFKRVSENTFDSAHSFIKSIEPLQRD